MTNIPDHVLAQIPLLAAEGLPVEQIAFMLQLSPKVVQAELRKQEADTTKKTPSKGRGATQS